MDVQGTTDMPGWKLINRNEHTIILTIDSYNKILCSLLINEPVEVIALISSGRVFHRILPLCFIDRWPKELANKSTWRLY